MSTALMTLFIICMLNKPIHIIGTPPKIISEDSVEMDHNGEGDAQDPTLVTSTNSNTVELPPISEIFKKLNPNEPFYSDCISRNSFFRNNIFSGLYLISYNDYKMRTDTSAAQEPTLVTSTNSSTKQPPLTSTLASNLSYDNSFNIRNSYRHPRYRYPCRTIIDGYENFIVNGSRYVDAYFRDNETIEFSSSQSILPSGIAIFNYLRQYNFISDDYLIDMTPRYLIDMTPRYTNIFEKFILSNLVDLFLNYELLIESWFIRNSFVSILHKRELIAKNLSVAMKKIIRKENREKKNILASYKFTNDDIKHIKNFINLLVIRAKEGQSKLKTSSYTETKHKKFERRDDNHNGGGSSSQFSTCNINTQQHSY